MKVTAAKRRADKRWNEKIVYNYREMSKLFWKEIKKTRSKKEGVVNGVKTSDGNIVQDKNEVEE